MSIRINELEIKKARALAVIKEEGARMEADPNASTTLVEEAIAAYREADAAIRAIKNLPADEQPEDIESVQALIIEAKIRKNVGFAAKMGKKYSKLAIGSAKRGLASFLDGAVKVMSAAADQAKK